jgi:hypothetical protein
LAELHHWILFSAHIWLSRDNSKTVFINTHPSFTSYLSQMHTAVYRSIIAKV